MIKPTASQQTAINEKRYQHFVRFTLDPQTTLTIGEDEIWESGFKVDQSVSGQSAFELGACVVNQLKVEIYNPNGTYQNTDFLGKPVYAYIDLYDTDGTTVIGTISKGHYIVDKADTNGGVIKLTCLDMLSTLDRPYTDVNTAYPATLYNIVNDIATLAGLTLSLDGANWLPSGITSSYTVTVRPTEVTCRDVLSAVCQATGNYATIDRLGQLLVTRYDTAFIAETGSDYSGYDYDEIDPSVLFSLSRDEAQVTLTGVSVEVGEDAYTAGTDDYMIHIVDNPVINAGSEQTFATALNTLVNGWNFRPFEADTRSNMCMEAGDNVIVTDTLGNVYKSIVTHVEYEAGNKQNAECNADPAAVQSSTRYSQAAKAASQTVKVYDSTVNNYIDLVSKGLGMYRSLITDPDDPTQQIYAFHNEETFANSTFCMFENGNGIQVGRRDTTSDPWVYTSASVEDAVVLAQTLVANTAIINQLFSEDITVTGKLHSDDYVAASPGASPPYAQQGMGIDFDEKEIEARNFAVDAGGNLYARSGKIGPFTIGGTSAAPYFYTDYTYWQDGSLYFRGRLRLSAPRVVDEIVGRISYEAIRIEVYVASSYDPSNPEASLWNMVMPPFEVNSSGRIGTTEAPYLYGGLHVGADTTQGVSIYDYIYSPGDTPAILPNQPKIGYIGKDSSGRLKLSATYGILADADIITRNSSGAKINQYGNFVHQRSTNTDTWEIANNAGTGVFKVNYETGVVTSNYLAKGNSSYSGVYGFNQNNTNLFYVRDTPISPSPNAGKVFWFVVRSDGINLWNATAGSGGWSISAPASLYNGTLKSGNTTFDARYGFYIIIGTSGGSAREGIVVPSSMLGTSDIRFLISDDACYLSFNMKKSGNTVTLTFQENKNTSGGTMTSGSIQRVFGFYYTG